MSKSFNLLAAMILVLEVTVFVLYKSLNKAKSFKRTSWLGITGHPISYVCPNTCWHTWQAPVHRK